MLVSACADAFSTRTALNRTSTPHPHAQTALLLSERAPVHYALDTSASLTSAEPRAAAEQRDESERAGSPSGALGKPASDAHAPRSDAARSLSSGDAEHVAVSAAEPECISAEEWRE